MKKISFTEKGNQGKLCRLWKVICDNKCVSITTVSCIASLITMVLTIRLGWLAHEVTFTQLLNDSTIGMEVTLTESQVAEQQTEQYSDTLPGNLPLDYDDETKQYLEVSPSNSSSSEGVAKQYFRTPPPFDSAPDDDRIEQVDEPYYASPYPGSGPYHVSPHSGPSPMQPCPCPGPCYHVNLKQ